VSLLEKEGFRLRFALQKTAQYSSSMKTKNPAGCFASFLMFFLLLLTVVVGVLAFGLGFLVKWLVPSIEIGHAMIFAAIVVAVGVLIFSQSSPFTFKELEDEDE
jgi:cytochrome b